MTPLPPSPPGTSALVRQLDPSPEVRALSMLPAIDYADAFTVTGPGAASAPPRNGPGPCWIRPRGWCGSSWWWAGPCSASGSGAATRRPHPRLAVLPQHPGSGPHRRGLTRGAARRTAVPAPAGRPAVRMFVQEQSRYARVLWPRVVPSHQRIVRSLLTDVPARPADGGQPATLSAATRSSQLIRALDDLVAVGLVEDLVPRVRVGDHGDVGQAGLLEPVGQRVSSVSPPLTGSSSPAAM